MFTLSRDVITVIFSYLSTKDIGRFGKVNKRALVLSRDDMFWRNRILSNIPTGVTNEYRKERSWYNYFVEDLATITKYSANRVLVQQGHKEGRRDKVLMAMSLITAPKRIRLYPRGYNGVGVPEGVPDGVPEGVPDGVPEGGCEYIYQRGIRKGSRCNEPYLDDGTLGSDTYCRMCIRKLSVRNKLGIPRL